MKYLPAIVVLILGLLVASCASTEKKKSLPSRQTDGSDLPWGRPSDWEGGIPGMMNNNSGRRF